MKRKTRQGTSPSSGEGTMPAITTTAPAMKVEPNSTSVQSCAAKSKFSDSQNSLSLGPSGGTALLCTLALRPCLIYTELSDGVETVFIEDGFFTRKEAILAPGCVPSDNTQQ